MYTRRKFMAWLGSLSLLGLGTARLSKTTGLAALEPVAKDGADPDAKYAEWYHWLRNRKNQQFQEAYTFPRPLESDPVTTHFAATDPLVDHQEDGGLRLRSEHSIGRLYCRLMQHCPRLSPWLAAGPVTLELFLFRDPLSDVQEADYHVGRPSLAYGHIELDGRTSRANERRMLNLVQTFENIIKDATRDEQKFFADVRAWLPKIAEAATPPRIWDRPQLHPYLHLSHAALNENLVNCPDIPGVSVS